MILYAILGGQCVIRKHFQLTFVCPLFLFVTRVAVTAQQQHRCNREPREQHVWSVECFCVLYNILLLFAREFGLPWLVAEGTHLVNRQPILQTHTVENVGALSYHHLFTALHPVDIRHLAHARAVYALPANATRIVLVLPRPRAKPFHALNTHTGGYHMDCERTNKLAAECVCFHYYYLFLHCLHSHMLTGAFLCNKAECDHYVSTSETRCIRFQGSQHFKTYWHWWVALLKHAAHPIRLRRGKSVCSRTRFYFFVPLMQDTPPYDKWNYHPPFLSSTRLRVRNCHPRTVNSTAIQT